MTQELWALVAFAGILMTTIVVQSMAVQLRWGIGYVLSSRDAPPDDGGVFLPRMERAVRNGVEGMALFAPLALASAVAGISNDVTSTAAWVFVAARAAHPVLYGLGAVPFRTMSWSISFFALFAFAYGLVAA